MLILTVVHICLSCSSWEETTFRGTSHQRQVHAVLGNLIHMHYPCEVTKSDGTISPATCWDDYVLAPEMTYGTAKGQCGVIFGSAFRSSFFKVLSLMHLTLLLLDFEIVEMILLAKRRHAGPHEECVREECSEAHESSYIKWTD
jgi:hypothetical protein